MGRYAESLFPTLNDLLTRSFVNHRKKILQNASGRILEIGFGSGLSVPCYPDSVHEVIGLEPSKGMRQRGLRNNNLKIDSRVTCIEGRAEILPFEDQSFDGVVSFLTLCSVSDLDKAVSEIRRVLKPTGVFYFIEHVTRPPHSFTYGIQKSLQPYWSKIACGCKLTQDTLGALKEAGMKLDLKPIGYSGFPNFLGPLYRGTAR